MLRQESVDSSGLKVLHLDHTSSLGGAEIALRRLCLNAQNWGPFVLLPQGSLSQPGNAFEHFADELAGRVYELGPAQKARAEATGTLVFKTRPPCCRHRIMSELMRIATMGGSTSPASIDLKA